jgi:hypothetical protein
VALIRELGIEVREPDPKEMAILAEVHRPKGIILPALLGAPREEAPAAGSWAREVNGEKDRDRKRRGVWTRRSVARWRSASRQRRRAAGRGGRADAAAPPPAPRRDGGGRLRGQEGAPRGAARPRAPAARHGRPEDAWGPATLLAGRLRGAGALCRQRLVSHERSRSRAAHALLRSGGDDARLAVRVGSGLGLGRGPLRVRRAGQAGLCSHPGGGSARWQRDAPGWAEHPFARAGGRRGWPRSGRACLHSHALSDWPGAKSRSPRPVPGVVEDSTYGVSGFPPATVFFMLGLASGQDGASPPRTGGPRSTGTDLRLHTRQEVTRT